MLSEKQIDHLYEALGTRIKNARVGAGYNQLKFSELLSMSRASLVNIEKGRQRPPLHIIYSIATLCKVDLIVLLPTELDVEENDLNKNLLKSIKDQSEGQIDIEESLLSFIRQTTSKIR